MIKKIKTTMSRLPEIWDNNDEPGNILSFTVGRGKREYHIWTCGPCGLHYCYASFPDGLGCKRAVEPDQTVFLLIKTRDL